MPLTGKGLKQKISNEPADTTAGESKFMESLEEATQCRQGGLPGSSIHRSQNQALQDRRGITVLCSWDSLLQHAFLPTEAEEAL